VLAYFGPESAERERAIAAYNPDLAWQCTTG
jgi:hypothetical protein